MTHSALGSSCRYAMASTTSQLITSAAAAPTVARYNVLRSSGTSLRADRPSHQFNRHPLNLRHVVVKNGLNAAIIPSDGYARPIRFRDGTKVGCCGSPTNAFADAECS